VKTVAISVLQRFRIWMSDAMERQLRKDIQTSDSLILIGLGVHEAIRDIERAAEGSVFKAELFDPFTVDARFAWICEDVASGYAEAVKVLGDIYSVRGGHFVAAIFGLRVMAETKSGWIAEKARASIKSKTELANQVLMAYRDYTNDMLERVAEDDIKGT
jgi:hypothetical protein